LWWFCFEDEDEERTGHEPSVFRANDRHESDLRLAGVAIDRPVWPVTFTDNPGKGEFKRLNVVALWNRPASSPPRPNENK
jgi:hypothetical protein